MVAFPDEESVLYPLQIDISSGIPWNLSDFT